MKPNCTIQGNMDRNGLGNRCYAHELRHRCLIFCPSYRAARYTSLHQRCARSPICHHHFFMFLGECSYRQQTSLVLAMKKSARQGLRACLLGQPLGHDTAVLKKMR